MKKKLLLSTIIITLLGNGRTGLADELAGNLAQPNDPMPRAGADIGFGIGFVTGAGWFNLDSVTLEQFLYNPSANAGFQVVLYKLDFQPGSSSPTVTLLSELGNPTVDSTVTQGQNTAVVYSPLVPVVLEPSSQYMVAAVTDSGTATGPALLFTQSDSLDGQSVWQLDGDYIGLDLGTGLSWFPPFEPRHLKFRVDGSVAPNRPPDVSQAYPSTATIWPPNGKFVPIQILGVTDPDGDLVTISITGIEQDEPVVTPGADTTSPDGIVDGSTAWVRAERLGLGNGRVYRVSFTATDGKPNGTASGEVYIQVPHDKGGQATAIDDGGATGYYDSTVQWPVSQANLSKK